MPKIRQFKIDPAKIGTVIGPGGKMINGLIAKYELAGIDIEEDGGVYVSGVDLAKVEAAVAEIMGMTKEWKVGEIVEGPIMKILEFGAIVDLGGGADGMIHVSELKQGFVKTGRRSRASRRSRPREDHQSRERQDRPLAEADGAAGGVTK